MLPRGQERDAWVPRPKSTPPSGAQLPTGRFAGLAGGRSAGGPRLFASLAPASGQAPHPRRRSPNGTPPFQSPGSAANGKQGEADHDAHREQPSRRVDCCRKSQTPRPHAHCACGWRQDMWRVLRTSLTSVSAYRGGGERAGKRSTRSDRLPTRGRRCRDPSFAVVPLAQPAPDSCHRRGYCPSVRRQFELRRHQLCQPALSK
jgi:hypothetical protein